MTTMFSQISARNWAWNLRHLVVDIVSKSIWFLFKLTKLIGIVICIVEVFRAHVAFSVTSDTQTHVFGVQSSIWGTVRKVWVWASSSSSLLARFCWQTFEALKYIERACSSFFFCLSFLLFRWSVVWKTQQGGMRRFADGLTLGVRHLCLHSMSCVFCWLFYFFSFNHQFKGIF